MNRWTAAGLVCLVGVSSCSQKGENGSGKQGAEMVVSAPTPTERSYRVSAFTISSPEDIPAVTARAQRFTGARQALVEAYLKYHTKPDTWWYQSPAKRSERGRLMPLAKREAAVPIDAFLKAPPNTPEAKEIARTFADRYAVSVIDVEERNLFLSRGTIPGGKNEDCRVGFAFYAPQNPYAKREVLGYAPDLRSVLLPGRRAPRIFYKSFVYHELGHRLRHRNRMLSGLPPLSKEEEWREEVGMHALGRAAFDQDTKGAYGVEIDRIAAQLSGDTVLAALEGLSVADLRGLDATLKLSGCSEEVARRVTIQYAVDITVAWIAVHLRPEQAEREAAKFFGLVAFDSLSLATSPG